MPCWDDIGETLILRTLDEAKLQRGEEAPIFHGSELQHIRKAFMSGQDPYPGLCDFCAARGHSGIETAVRPRAMEVLHIEPSYLCHLSCPCCIPAKERRGLKSPPYHMSPEMMEGLLRELRSEGVQDIRFIHFEGRGDPLMNPVLETLIRLSRHYFPKSFIGVTTHCSYPYMPWIARSDLNLFRASIDGATSASYQRYRVGGNFERAIEFLRRLRDDRLRTASSPHVEWKYILFEWNDTSEEMQLAADLARELQVRLTFTRTHSPGHSWRFRTDESLRDHVLRLGLGVGADQTFQLRSEAQAGGAEVLISDHVVALLSLAVDRLRVGDAQDAIHNLVEALKFDPEISIAETDAGDVVRTHRDQILAKVRFPSTLTWLAAISRECGDMDTSDALLMRYLELAPDAPDRKPILFDHFVGSAIREADRKNLGAATDALNQASELEFGAEFDDRQTASRALVCAAGCVALAREDYTRARTLFIRCLELAPEPSTRKWVEGLLADAVSRAESRSGR